MRTIPLLFLLAACPGGDSDDTVAETDVTIGEVDFDQDGSPEGVDCDDNDFEVYPGADEYCDGKDNDCDEEVDEDAIDADLYYGDADRDGYGNDDSEILACDPPPDTAQRGGDCDDNNDAISPAAVEVCDDNNVDEDCSGAADDEDPSVSSESQTTFYADTDEDGFGDPESPVQACDAASDRVADNTDCDDTDPKVNPRDGCAVDWDGEWTVRGSITVIIPERKISDTCTFSLGVTVDSASRETVRTTSRGVCAMRTLGTKNEVWVRGSFSGESTLFTQIYVDKTTIDTSSNLTADPDRWSASGSDSMLWAGLKATVEHELDGRR